MRRLNKTAKMAFYTARKRQGDTTKIAEQSGYSVSHVSNIMAGRRSVNSTVANVMYNISRRRVKTSELV
jgi:transcriptional regulator with XRE-family HTH domain